MSAIKDGRSSYRFTCSLLVLIWAWIWVSRVNVQVFFVSANIAFWLTRIYIAYCRINTLAIRWSKDFRWMKFLGWRAAKCRMDTPWKANSIISCLLMCKVRYWYFLTVLILILYHYYFYSEQEDEQVLVTPIIIQCESQHMDIWAPLFYVYKGLLLVCSFIHNVRGYSANLSQLCVYLAIRDCLNTLSGISLAELDLQCYYVTYRFICWTDTHKYGLIQWN